MSDDTIEQLERLDALRSRGALSDDEFAAQKEALLEVRPGGPALPAVASEPKEQGYDGATENVALAGYIFAIVFPVVGLILGIVLLTRNRPRAGWVVIIVSSLIILAGAAITMLLIAESSQPVEGGLRDVFE